MATAKTPIPEEGAEDTTVDYYDIMVIGRTGMGKSTTSDKLVIANLDGRDYSGEQYTDEIVEAVQVKMSDLSMWLIADDDEIERVKVRLKNLVLFRSLDRGLKDPHAHVNDFYQKSSKQTTKSQLISNETTMVRILDVPGFDCDRTPETATSRVTAKGLAIMREVLRIQATMRMNFRRILYFIPERGPLELCHEVLRMELEQMVHYFGRSIFDCMVLIATVNPDVYQYLQPGATPFSNNAEMKTRQKFQEALCYVLPPGEQLSDHKPPIVFISMNDTCEEIYRKIHSAPVIFDCVRLAFDYRTCACCGIKVKFLGEGKEEVKVACYAGEDPSNSIPYEESLCHPLIISKYQTITKVVGSIAHFITAKRFLGKWPDFRNPDDEICVHCGQVPGTRGCKPVNTHYELKGGQLFVDHKCDLNEPVDVVLEIDVDTHHHLQQPATTGEHVAMPIND